MQINPQIQACETRLATAFNKPLTEELLNTWQEALGNKNIDEIHSTYLKIIQGEVQRDETKMPTPPEFLAIMKKLRLHNKKKEIWADQEKNKALSYSPSELIDRQKKWTPEMKSQLKQVMENLKS